MARNRITPSLMAILMLTACGLSPEEQVKRGEESFAANRFSSARLDLVAALKERPGDVRAAELLARTYLELGDGEAAMAALDGLAERDALPADGAILRGEADLLRGRFRKAIDHVAAESSADAWRIRALAHIGLEDIDSAAQAFDEGAGASGPIARLRAEQARFELGRGNLAQARKLAEAALAQGPDVLEAQLATAQVAAADGRLGDALKAFEAASSAYPENRSALIGRIATLGDLGRTEGMKPLLEDLGARAPDDLSVRYLTARLAAASGDWERTRKELQEVEARLNELPQSRLLYGQALAELGLSELAATHLASYLRINPAHRLARRLLAGAQLESGNASAAVETLRPLAVRPEANVQELTLMAAATGAARSPDAATYAARAEFPAAEMLASELALADNAMKREDWRSAARSYSNVLEATGSGNILVLNNAAYVQGQLGNYDPALKLARQALKKAPDNASVLDTTGWLMVRSGDREGGLPLLRKAARLAPDNRAIARHLAEAERGQAR